MLHLWYLAFIAGYVKVHVDISKCTTYHHNSMISQVVVDVFFPFTPLGNCVLTLMPFEHEITINSKC